MAKDEFSVNELEPERNTLEVTETTQSNNERLNDAALLNQEAEALETKKKLEEQENVKLEEDEYQGPTLKEVIANSVNPDYQGPTAKEIVVNSVKVDNTKKKNLVGLVVLIIVLFSVGIIIGFEMFSDDSTKRTKNYLDGMPEWVNTYNEYFKKEYKDLVAYNVSFLDLDFDDKPEAIVYYIKDGKTVYEIIDTGDKQYIKFDELSDIYMMYSFDNEVVTWYANTSINETDMNLIDIGKRLKNNNDFEINLSLDTLSQFKSNHFTLSYQIKYTKISFRTVEQNLAESVRIYDTEKDNVKGIIDNVIEKYSEDI